MPRTLYLLFIIIVQGVEVIAQSEQLTAVVIPETVAGTDLWYSDLYWRLVNVFLSGVFDRTKDAWVIEPCMAPICKFLANIAQFKYCP